PRHRAIVRTITAFADELGLALTAEGIETRGQQAMLKALGCRYGQGYLFSQALPPDDFEQMLLGTARILG
ncbi:MAG: EAL domain-containing protein, partial [Arenimonas sp.]|uniref:EAL domain-containing protein n=1 Tax=Arenimonas sp. TaxID=1872635 RepID=UPI0025BD9AC5